MTFLDEQEKAALADQIIAAEQRTRGEIVTVIAAASDGYRYIPILWAALLALAVPGLYLAWQALSTGGWFETPPDPWAPLIDIYLVQVLVFFLLGSLFQLPAVRLALIPARIKRQRASRYAHEQFFLQNLHQTEQGTGLLIFVSVAEHYVEIIVDRGISERVHDTEWESVVEEFTTSVRRGEIAEGFRNAVSRCGTILQREFPASGRNPNELPNPLVEV